MKPEKNKEAKILRKNGQSIKQIAKTLRVSPSSVSTWTKNVRLTKQQLLDLRIRGSGMGLPAAAKAWSAKNRNKRIEYQQRGREDAKQGNLLHAMGCMLYWGEGAKRNNKNVVKIINGDSFLLRIFVCFIQHFFEIEESSIRVNIRYYSNNGFSIEEVENYWKSQLEIPDAKYKISESNDTRSKLKDTGKLPYGICQIVICNTETVQRIFGAIKEYAGINDNRWVDRL